MPLGELLAGEAAGGRPARFDLFGGQARELGQDRGYLCRLLGGAPFGLGLPPDGDRRGDEADLVDGSCSGPAGCTACRVRRRSRGMAGAPARGRRSSARLPVMPAGCGGSRSTFGDQLSPLILRQHDRCRHHRRRRGFRPPRAVRGPQGRTEGEDSACPGHRGSPGCLPGHPGGARRGGGVAALTGPLLASATGGRLRQGYLWELVRRLARAAGVGAWEQLSPHSLRHSAITYQFGRRRLPARRARLRRPPRSPHYYGSCSSLSWHLVGVGVPALVGLLGLVLVASAP
jgi:hypothetical protein